MLFPFGFRFITGLCALSFLENQHYILREIEEEAIKQGFDPTLYTEVRETANIEKKPFQEYWVGHSLGCKYIGLLELLTDFEIFDRKDALCQCVGHPQAQYIDTLIDKSSLETISLYNQPSILLDPVISDLDNAVPIRALQRLFSRVVKVLPSRKETFYLVNRERLFSLTSIISFESKLSQESGSQLKTILEQRLSHFQRIAINLKG